MDAAAGSGKEIRHNQAIEQRLKSILGRIVEHGDTVDNKDDLGESALHLVAQYWGDIEPGASEVETFDQAHNLPLNFASALGTARLFLANEAEVDSSDRRGRTPLYIAVKFNNCKMASALLKYGADASAADDERMAPLHQARSAWMAKLLLKNGALVNAGDEFGRTPLHSAVGSDRLNVMRVLIKFGADIDATDRSGGTALHWSVESGSIEKTRDTTSFLLKAGVNVNAENNEGYTAIQEAIKSLKEEKVLALLEQKVEAFPQTARHQSIIGRGLIDERYAKIGRLIDASIKLKAAGLSPTRDSLMALAHKPREDYFSFFSGWEGSRNNVHVLKLGCEAELKKLKNHVVTDTMSLHDAMFTDSVPCAPSQSLLDILQVVNYGGYPMYEDFMMNKFKKLNLMVLTMKRVCVLLRAGKTNVPNLPEELVVKILVHLDNATLKKLILCCNSVS